AGGAAAAPVGDAGVGATGGVDGAAVGAVGAAGGVDGAAVGAADPEAAPDPLAVIDAPGAAAPSEVSGGPSSCASAAEKPPAEPRFVPDSAILAPVFVVDVPPAFESHASTAASGAASASKVPRRRAVTSY